MSVFWNRFMRGAAAIVAITMGLVVVRGGAAGAPILEPPPNSDRYAGPYAQEAVEQEARVRSLMASFIESSPEDLRASIPEQFAQRWGLELDEGDPLLPVQTARLIADRSSIELALIRRQSWRFDSQTERDAARARWSSMFDSLRASDATPRQRLERYDTALHSFESFVLGGPSASTGPLFGLALPAPTQKALATAWSEARAILDGDEPAERERAALESLHEFAQTLFRTHPEYARRAQETVKGRVEDPRERSVAKLRDLSRAWVMEHAAEETSEADLALMRRAVHESETNRALAREDAQAWATQAITALASLIGETCAVADDGFHGVIDTAAGNRVFAQVDAGRVEGGGYRIELGVVVAMQPTPPLASIAGLRVLVDATGAISIERALEPREISKDSRERSFGNSLDSKLLERVTGRVTLEPSGAAGGSPPSIARAVLVELTTPLTFRYTANGETLSVTEGVATARAQASMNPLRTKELGAETPRALEISRLIAAGIGFVDGGPTARGSTEAAQWVARAAAITESDAAWVVARAELLECLARVDMAQSRGEAARVRVEALRRLWADRQLGSVSEEVVASFSSTPPLSPLHGFGWMNKAAKLARGDFSRTALSQSAPGAVRDESDELVAASLALVGRIAVLLDAAAQFEGTLEMRVARPDFARQVAEDLVAACPNIGADSAMAVWESDAAVRRVALRLRWHGALVAREAPAAVPADSAPRAKKSEPPSVVMLSARDSRALARQVAWDLWALRERHQQAAPTAKPSAASETASAAKVHANFAASLATISKAIPASPTIDARFARLELVLARFLSDPANAVTLVPLDDQAGQAITRAMQVEVDYAMGVGAPSKVADDGTGAAEQADTGFGRLAAAIKQASQKPADATLREEAEARAWIAGLSVLSSACRALGQDRAREPEFRRAVVPWSGCFIQHAMRSQQVLSEGELLLTVDVAAP